MTESNNDDDKHNKIDNHVCRNVFQLKVATMIKIKRVFSCVKQGEE